ncbi:MAG: cytidylate kinase-like family protein [Clostridiales bacterium]|nr:cytidylate kinase-like family protein [Clostridiales bacterium]
MSKQIIISIGREFGSGGHYIAEQLSERLGIPLLDKNLIQRVAEEKGYSEDAIRQFDEKGTSILFARSINGYTSSASENIAQAQFEVLRRDAKEGMSFIVVGRCAEDILADQEALISIFIRSTTEAKKARIMEKYSLSEDKALSLMKKMDRERKFYHNYYCHHKWGDSRGYDLTINSALLGVDGTVDLIEQIVKARQ